MPPGMEQQRRAEGGIEISNKDFLSVCFETGSYASDLLSNQE